jgi:hypothetical protein
VRLVVAPVFARERVVRAAGVRLVVAFAAPARVVRFAARSVAGRRVDLDWPRVEVVWVRPAAAARLRRVSAPLRAAALREVLRARGVAAPAAVLLAGRRRVVAGRARLWPSSISGALRCVRVVLFEVVCPLGMVPSLFEAFGVPDTRPAARSESPGRW